MKQIVVACGSGVATSQTVASKVNRLLKENNIPAEVLAVDIKSVHCWKLCLHRNHKSNKRISYPSYQWYRIFDRCWTGC